MTDVTDFIKLQTWLSPSFPTGAFSYSQGLEAAIEHGLIQDKQDLADWLATLISDGAGWNEALLISECWGIADDTEALKDVAELARALCFSKLRLKESCEQGQAFLKAAQTWQPDLDEGLMADCPLPVAVGVLTGRAKIDQGMVLAAYLNAYASNLIQASLRLMKLGQQGGLSVLASLEPVIAKTAAKALASDLDAMSANTFAADICAIKHETLTSRIFIS